LLDTNVLVAAMKNPARETETLRLLIRIIENQRIRLVADELLLEEMLRYAEILKSPTAATISAAIAIQNSHSIARAFLWLDVVAFDRRNFTRVDAKAALPVNFDVAIDARHGRGPVNYFERTL